MWDWDWDEAKRQANLAKHGVDFALIAGFEWTSADIKMDGRFDYANCASPPIG